MKKGAERLWTGVGRGDEWREERKEEMQTKTMRRDAVDFFPARREKWGPRAGMIGCWQFTASSGPISPRPRHYIIPVVRDETTMTLQEPRERECRHWTAELIFAEITKVQFTILPLVIARYKPRP